MAKWLDVVTKHIIHVKEMKSQPSRSGGEHVSEKYSRHALVPRLGKIMEAAGLA